MRKEMAIGTDFACRDIRYPEGRPEEVEKPVEEVEEIESGPMEVQATSEYI